MICAKNMTELEVHCPGNPYATTYCFAAIYIMQLLTDAYGLSMVEGTPLLVDQDIRIRAQTGFLVLDSSLTK